MQKKYFVKNIFLCDLQVTLDDDIVKSEPVDPGPSNDDSYANSAEDDHVPLEDNKEDLHAQLGFDPSEGVEEDHYEDMDPSMLSEQQMQGMEDCTQGSAFQQVSWILYSLIFFYCVCGPIDL